MTWGLVFALLAVGILLRHPIVTGGLWLVAVLLVGGIVLGAVWTVALCVLAVVLVFGLVYLAL